MWQLIDPRTKAEVVTGTALLTFRNEPCVLESWDAPHTPSSTGRVYVRFTGDERDGSYVQSFYPTVCGLKIVRVEE